MQASLPWRGSPAERPPSLVVPPARMPLVRDGRPLKRWSYVAAFSERLMLCAAEVRIGPLRQSFWAVWDRERRALREHTDLLGRGVRVRDRTVVVDHPGLRARLRVEPGTSVETASPHGPSWIWTRKEAGMRVHGTATVAGEEISVDARGCVDESAGYHARRTAWRWSAGVGDLEDGRPVAWNLVEGLHDAARASERTVWVAGVPHEVGPVRFAADLGAVAFAEGGALTFTAEATRARRDELLVAGSDYVQPFGTFAGALPGAGVLAGGLGVMERHTARW